MSKDQKQGTTETAVLDRPEPREIVRRPDTAFSCIAAFEDAQRMAVALSKSDLVPTQYRENMPNCLLALEMSQRLGMNPLMVMQNMYIVHGKPAWSSQFMIACINGSGHFSPLRYDLTGEEGTNSRTCIAWAYDKGTGERLESPAVSIKMAKDEGWYSKNGSKWQTMPELMLRYRAATFFGRTYCPELTMGMHTEEEYRDIGDAVVVSTVMGEEREKAKSFREKMKKGREKEADSGGSETKTEKPAQEREEPKQEPKEDTTPKDRVPGEDDDLDDCPAVYVRMRNAYETNARLVDRCMEDVGLPSITELEWQSLDEVGLNKLNRAAAKFSKKLTEG